MCAQSVDEFLFSVLLLWSIIWRNNSDTYAGLPKALWHRVEEE